VPESALGQVPPKKGTMPPTLSGPVPPVSASVKLALAELQIPEMMSKAVPPGDLSAIATLFRLVTLRPLKFTEIAVTVEELGMLAAETTTVELAEAPKVPLMVMGFDPPTVCARIGTVDAVDRSTVKLATHRNVRAFCIETARRAVLAIIFCISPPAAWPLPHFTGSELGSEWR